MRLFPSPSARPARLGAAVLSASALAAGSLVTAGGPASAAPAVLAAGATTCSASTSQIYAAQSGSITEAPGTILACRKVLLTTTTAKVPTTGYQLRYVTTNLSGKKIATSGIVLVPKVEAPTSALNIAAWSSTTVGLGSQCAASRQFGGGFVDNFEVASVSDFLNDGHIVAMSDGVGYLTGEVHNYVNGVNNGRAQLDMARAATKVPGAGINRAAKILLNGYSEGGGTTLWAAQMARSYAPELPIVGAAAGAPPSDLRATAANLNGQFYAGFLADAVVGLSAAYPQMPFDELLNDKGRTAVADVKKQCLAGTLLSWTFKKIEDYTVGGIGLEKIYTLKGADGKTWGQVADAQTVGIGVGRVGSGAKYEMGMPVLNYWGGQDDVIPPASIKAGVSRYCAAGVKMRSKVYLGLHATTNTIASADVRAWAKDRFAGKAEPGNC